MGIFDFLKRRPKDQVSSGTPHAARNAYDAATTLARYGDLSSSSGSADYELANALVPLRNKSRNLYRNSSAQRRYVQLMRVNICGENGFQLQSRVRMTTDSMKLNRSLNKSVEQEWRDWWAKPTACGEMSGEDLTKQAIASRCNDGEVIWEIVFGLEYPSGIAVNPIEADLLDETLTTINKSTGNRIKMGVEVTKTGRPVAYHFLQEHPGDLAGIYGRERNRHRRVPAERVIHMFDRYRPGQTRGEPPAAPVIHPVKMLNGYREAETMSRRLRAAVMGFFTKNSPTPEAISQLADREDTADELFEMDVDPGRFKSLPTGYDFKQFDPGGVQADYQDFEAQVKKDQAMGYGISTFSHGMETAGVSYSTGRTVAIEDRDYYKMEQRLFIDGLFKKLFRIWLPRRILETDSMIPASRIGTILEKVKFRGRGWDWVDPAKDVKANTEALRTNQTSLARVAAQRGIDRDELLDEIQEDQLAAKDRGLTLDYDDGNNVAQEPDETQESDEDDN